MTTTNTIVVAVDGAWRKSGAVDWAADEAVLSRCPVRAVHVAEHVRHPYPPVQLDGAMISPVELDQASARLTDDAAEYLAERVEGLDAGGEVIAGDPAEVLVRLSRSARLVVLGRRGLGAFGRLLIGSTSDAVSNLGQGPVIVVPEGWRGEEHRGMPVVVGIDAHHDSTDASAHDAALAFAAEVAERRAVRLLLVHGWDVPSVYTWQAIPPGDEIARLRAEARRRLTAVTERWQAKYPQLEIRGELRQGHPVAVLLAAADDAGAQLLVIGGHRRRLATRMLLGSVARGVLHHASSPVAVVHERP